jgi:hypothetical protein
MTQLERVCTTFTVPAKTFADIAAGRRNWWLPFVLMVACSYLLFGVITARIGWAQVAENTIHLNAKTAEKMAQLPAEQRETSMKVSQYVVEGSFAANPIAILLTGAVVSLVLWGTLNFVFGGKATFFEVLAVWMYASLPSLIKTLLGTIVGCFTAPESFNLANFAPTNVGAFLSSTETNAALYKLATALDVTTIWSMVLLGIGLAVVGRVKRSAGYTAVFGWWALWLVVSVGLAAVQG